MFNMKGQFSVTIRLETTIGMYEAGATEASVLCPESEPGKLGHFTPELEPESSYFVRAVPSQCRSSLNISRLCNSDMTDTYT